MGWSYWQNNGDQISAAGNGPVVLAAGSPVVYSTDGAIAAPGTAVLTKGSAGAYTLAAPTADGQSLIVTSGSAFAHVVTATSLYQDGVTGGAKTTATFAAFVGASMELKAYAGKWNTIALKGVTIS